MLPEQLAKLVEEIPQEFSQEERQEWMKQMKGVSVSSDAFFPFRDNIDRAKQVSFILY